MRMSRKTSLSWVLRTLALHFELKGWSLAEKPTSLLKMTQAPSSDVLHTLLIHEPFRPSDLPAKDVIGLACAVNVYFPELEASIDQALDRQVATGGKISTHLVLSQLVPAEHVFAGNVHLIFINNDVQRAVEPLESDFATYLEPARGRLSLSSVFQDEVYRPPKVDLWSWQLRRAAYYRCRMGTSEQRALFAELEKQALDLLGLPAANESAQVSLFADMATVQKSAALRGAEELRRFLAAVR